MKECNNCEAYKYQRTLPITEYGDMSRHDVYKCTDEKAIETYKKYYNRLKYQEGLSMSIEGSDESCPFSKDATNKRKLAAEEYMRKKEYWKNYYEVHEWYG